MLRTSVISKAFNVVVGMATVAAFTVTGTYAAHGAALAAHASAKCKGATSVDIALDWSWDPDQTPLIVALTKGYYRDVGLNVNLIQTSGSGAAVGAVGAGQDPIGYVDLTTAASGIANGTPVIAVTSLEAKGPNGLMWLKSTPIKSLKSLIGKKIGSTPTGSDATFLPAFLKANHLTHKVSLVNLPGNAKLQALLSGQVDAISGQVYYYQGLAEAQGKKTAGMVFGDHHLNTEGLGIIANNSFLSRHPSVVKAFVSATLRGYRWSYASSAHLNSAILDYLQFTKGVTGESPSTVRVILKGLGKLLGIKSKTFGENHPKLWRQTLTILRTYGGLTSTGAPTYFTNKIWSSATKRKASVCA